MVAQPGHIAIFVPDFAAPPIRYEDLGIYEYQDEHRRAERNHRRGRQFVYTGFWS
jgi:hypothetical protein